MNIISLSNHLSCLNKCIYPQKNSVFVYFTKINFTKIFIFREILKQIFMG